jgi:hypothetical protein
LIRTAEQLKIKGLCEINDHTNAVESDTEVIYPPHKKIRASRNYEASNLSTAVNNRNSTATRGEQQDSTSKNTSSSSSSSSSSLPEKDAHQSSIASQEDSNNTKNKSKSPSKESKSSQSNSNNLQQSSSKNMASLDMGMVSNINQLFTQLKPFHSIITRWKWCKLGSEQQFSILNKFEKYLFFSSLTPKKLNKFFYVFFSQNYQNGNVVMSVPLTYMDFAPDPPAPTATPVITADMNVNPSPDTKDLSRKLFTSNKNPETFVFNFFICQNSQSQFFFIFFCCFSCVCFYHHLSLSFFTNPMLKKKVEE